MIQMASCLHLSLGGGYASRNGENNILASRIGVTHQTIWADIFAKLVSGFVMLNFALTIIVIVAFALYLTCWRASD